MTGPAGSVTMLHMAPQAKPVPQKGPPPAKGPVGKGPAGKGAGVPKGKAASEPAPAELPPPGPGTRRLKIVIFSVLGAALLGTLAAAGWAVFLREEEPVVVDIPPPTPAPPRPKGPVVRQGDLREELQQRMGVRPQGE